MLIYIFAEHYPNPYKPQFDSEFAFLIRQGLDVRIFAAGQYLSTIHPRVAEYGLVSKTSLYPTTLRRIPRHLPRMLWRLVRSPRESIRGLVAVCRSSDPWKRNLLRCAIVLNLPSRHPDICYVHNIATADQVDFLQWLYPSARLALYFHGGELGGVRRVVRDRFVLSHIHSIPTNTNYSRDLVISRGSPADRTVVVPVGFDIGDYPDDPDREYRRDGILRLISVGRLSEEKGLRYAIEALAHIAKEGRVRFHYTIVGRGTHEQELRRDVIDRGLIEYVSFAGERNKAQVVALLKESDVLLLPSIPFDTGAETQAGAVQEAMFMRLLVIGTQVGGVQESTADVLKDLSVPTQDVSAIVSSINRIAKMSDMEIRKRGSLGREWATERYDIEKTGPALLSALMGGESLREPHAQDATN